MQRGACLPLRHSVRQDRRHKPRTSSTLMHEIKHLCLEWGGHGQKLECFSVVEHERKRLTVYLLATCSLQLVHGCSGPRAPTEIDRTIPGTALHCLVAVEKPSQRGLLHVRSMYDINTARSRNVCLPIMESASISTLCGNAP